MKSGQSSSEARPSGAHRTRAGYATAALVLALQFGAGGGSGGAAAQDLAPPPDNPEPTPTPTPKGARPRYAPCPRCGYLCDPGWNHCVFCGWDRRRLVGETEENRLREIASASVGITVGGRRNRYTTAFPVGPSGLLITSARALANADQALLKVRTHNNREYGAKIVGYDLPSGIGVLRAEIPELEALSWATTEPSPPEAAWVICYPIVREDDLVRYLPVSFHRGQLNATGQSGTAYVSFENLLRSDHAIEEGCIGGPLIDSQGLIVGMVVGSPEDGLTYALPLRGLQPLIDTLAAGDTPGRPYYGVGLVAPDERRRERFGLEADASGPLIAYLISGSPGEKAGLRAGDLLRAVNGEKVTTVFEAGERLLAAAPDGRAVSLSVWRGAAEQVVKVAPVKRPDDIMLEPTDELQEGLQATLEEAGPEDGGKGLVVAALDRGGRGEKARFRKGDLILAVDKRSIKSFADYNEEVHRKSWWVKKIEKDPETKEKDRWSSLLYFVDLLVRTPDDQKVTRRYMSMFPVVLAPPVY